MMNYKFGDIVLIGFPYKGTTDQKKRPALVILDIKDNDIVLAPITSKEKKDSGDYELQDWKKSDLLSKSWVRLSKIACLSKNDIVRMFGALSKQDKSQILEIWTKTFQDFFKEK